MKKYLLLALTFIGLFSCTNNSINGHYVKIGGNNILGVTLISEITFDDNNCHFDYVGITMGAKYSIDGKHVYIDAGGEIGTLTMTIIDSETLEGEGWISGVF